MQREYVNRGFELPNHIREMGQKHKETKLLRTAKREWKSAHPNHKYKTIAKQAF